LRESKLEPEDVDSLCNFRFRRLVN